MTGAAYYLKFDELAEAIGRESAGVLVEHFGGTRIYVPEKFPPDHRIVLAIGAEAGSRLVAHIATGIGGLAVDLPTHHAAEFFGYRQRLQDAVSNSDRSEAALAAELGVHGRTIRRMRAKLRKEREALIEKATFTPE